MHRVRYSPSFWLLFLLATLAGGMTICAEDSPVLRVGFPSNHDTGNPYGGALVEKLQSEIPDCKLEYSDNIPTIDEGKAMLLDGRLDVLGMAFKKPDDDPRLCYSAMPYGYTVLQVLCRPLDSGKFKPSHATWRNAQIGYCEGSPEQNAFKTYALRNNISYSERLYPSDEAVHQALQNGEVDLAILDNAVTRHDHYDGVHCYILEELETIPWYLATTQENAENLKRLDHAFGKLHEADPSWHEHLLKKYFIGRDVNVLVMLSGNDDIDNHCREFLRHIGEVNSWRIHAVEFVSDLLPDYLGQFDLVCGIPICPQTREKLDFPLLPITKRPLYLLGRNDDKYSDDEQIHRYLDPHIAFPQTIPEKTEFFQYLLDKNVGYELSYCKDSAEALGRLEKSSAPLAITGCAFSTSHFRILTECGKLPYYIASPKERKDYLYALKEALEYCYFCEADYLKGLAERYLHEAEPQGRVVRVALYGEVGLAQPDENGVMNGYTVDYIRKIAEKAGWTLEELPTNYVNAQRYVAEGRADLLLCAIITPERLKLYDYSRSDIGPLYYGFMTRQDSSLKPSRPDTWQNARIGYYRGTKANLDLKRFLEERGVIWESVVFDALEDAEQAVRDGQLDAVYTLLSRHSQDLRPLAAIPTQPTYICVTKGNTELLAELDDAMSEIHRYDSDFQNRISELYFTRNQDVLTMGIDELQVIEQLQEEPLRVSLYPLLAPLKEYDNEANTAVGFIKNICEKITEETGLQFVYLNLDSEEEVREQLINGSCDIWFGHGASFNATRHLPCVPDAIQTQAAIIRRQGVSMRSKDTDGVVALTADDKFLQSQLRPNQKVLICQNRRECYRAVVSHKADLTIDSLQAASVVLLPGKTDFPSLAFQPVDQHDFMLPFPIYFSPQLDPKLMSLTEDAIRAIPAETVNDFLFEAVFGRQSPFLTGMQLSLMLGLIVFLGLLVVVLILMHFNDQLKQERDAALAARTAQQNAEILRMEQEAASKAKSSFLFNMSHDIRTPMNAITGYTAMAQKQIGNPVKVSDYLAKIEVSSKHLLELINGVLDMSRIESGKLTLNEEPCDLTDIANGLLTICDGNAKKKHLSLIPQFEKLEHPVVVTDALRLNQVLLNIVNNAIKYTPEGGTVTFKLSQKACEDPEKVECIAVVKDTGIGMSEEFQRKLFEPFSREKNTTVSGIEGTGLGLAIVKHIIDLMGAKIQIQSEQGKGTEIAMHFTFPIAQDDTDTSASQSAILELSEEVLKGKRVLLVEDNEMNREIAREMLQGHRMVVEEAEDGDIAVRMVSQNAPGYYAFVLMDVQMPRMNGYDATRAIRKMTAQNDERLPIIAMTANAFAEDKKNALDAGMDAHLAKPIHENEVIAMLRKFV